MSQNMNTASWKLVTREWVLDDGFKSGTYFECSLEHETIIRTTRRTMVGVMGDNVGKVAIVGSYMEL